MKSPEVLNTYYNQEPSALTVLASKDRGRTFVVDTDYEEIDLASIKTERILDPEIGRYHNPIVLITGPSSSGKDLLCREASVATGARSIGSGDLISEIAGVKNDDVRFMQFSDYYFAKMRAASVIRDKAPCIINAHLVTKHYLTSSSEEDPKEVNNPGYIVVEAFEAYVNPMHLVAVVAKPEEIYTWRIDRNLSGTRTSDWEDADVIARHERLTIVETYKMARRLGAGFSIVYNTARVKETAENVRFIASLVNHAIELAS